VRRAHSHAPGGGVGADGRRSSAGGGGFWSFFAAAPAPAAPVTKESLRADLERVLASLEALKASNFRRSFHVVPGRTEVVIPVPADGTSFPTPFVFQLINPAVSHTAPSGGAGEGGMERLEVLAAGREQDVLTLCAETSSQRREWIVYLKARLRTRSLSASLKDLYLSRWADGE
jgi:hypothetical protein